MTTRRYFMKTAAAGVGAATLGTTAAVEAAAPNPGPRQMPRGVTLLSMVQADGSETLGVKLSNGVLDVASAGKALKIETPLTLETLLASGNAASLEQLISAAKARREFVKDEPSIKFGRLFTTPGKIVCVGLNYKEHAEEAGEKLS